MKVIFAIDMGEKYGDPTHYPDVENPDNQTMAEFDIAQVDDNIISESEYMDNLLQSGGVLEISIEP